MFPTAQIVITGGPASGKSSILEGEWLAQQLHHLGVRPFFYPELASQYYRRSITDISELAKRDYPRYARVQAHLIEDELRSFESAQEIMAVFCDQQPVITLRDRGPMDAQYYVGRPYFEAALHDKRLTYAEVRDCYDGVIHLITSADGAEEVFRRVSRNNPARREHDPKFAIQVDRGTLQTWVGHPHLRVIGNSRDFAYKEQQVLEAIKRVIGIPATQEIERGYLLAGAPKIPKAARPFSRQIEIEQVYLGTKGKDRIRRWRDGAGSTYFRTQKPGEYGLVRQEVTTRITALEYQDLKRQADPFRRPITKQRTCLVWGHDYWEIDCYRLLDGSEVWKAEIELGCPDQKVELPPFFEVTKEVTGNPAYSAAVLAKRC